MSTPCKECGYPLNGTETSCPECGCPVELSSDDILQSAAAPDRHFVDDWDYTQYRKGLFQQWYFECIEEDRAESYDALNDVLLMLNLIFRAVWYLAWRMALVGLVFFIIYGALFAAMAQSDSSEGMIVLGGILAFILILIGLYIFFTLIAKVIHKYWVPFHRTWRRINKRYWISMHKAVKTNNPNTI